MKKLSFPQLALRSRNSGLPLINVAGSGFIMTRLRFFPMCSEWIRPRGPLVVRFDSHCLMCCRGIRFLAIEDRADLIRFQPLGGDGAPDTMLVETGGRVFERSNAVLAILRGLGGKWAVLAWCGALIPRILRDRLYDVIASRRYRWFGKTDACAFPDEEVARRMIK